MSNVARELASFLVLEGGLFDDKTFGEAVNDCVDQRILDQVEKQIEEIDLTDSVINDFSFHAAVLDIIKDQMVGTDHTSQIEDLQDQLDAKGRLIETLVGRLEALESRMARQEENYSNQFKWLFNLTNKLCSIPIIGKYFNPPTF